jgi:DNA-binding protein H-NS
MYEFSIKVKNTDLHKSSSKSINLVENISNRSESVVRDQMEEEDGSAIKEESMTVTFDSFKIKAKKTTTPRRLLNGYSMNKRSFNSITPSDKNTILNNPLSSSKS